MRSVLRALFLAMIIVGSINLIAYSETATDGVTCPTPPVSPTPVPIQGAAPVTAPTYSTIAPAPITQAAVPPLRTIGAQTVGDYRFQLVSAPALGWYEPQTGQLVWVPPAINANQHLEVVLTNTIDQRPLPNAVVRVSIYDENNRLIETKTMAMLWATVGYHYGNNFTIPAAGNYNVKVDVVTPPMFARHHKQLGNRFFKTETVTFKNVALKPEGQFKE